MERDNTNWSNSQVVLQRYHQQLALTATPVLCNQHILHYKW